MRIFPIHPFTSILPVACLAGVLLSAPAFGHGAAPDRLAAIATALTRNPDNAGLLVEQADLLVEHGSHERARSALDRADQLAPGVFPTDRVRARLLLDEGRIKEALPALDQALERFPDDGRALTLRARAYHAAGKREASLSDYRVAWEVTAAPDADLAVEVADALAGNGHPEEAAALLKKALQNSGRMPSLLTRLIDLEVDLGRPADAIVWAEAMRDRAPRPEPWMARRAELLGLAGRPDEARVAWTELSVHLAKLPSIERGSPALRALADRAAKAMAVPSSPRPAG